MMRMVLRCSDAECNGAEKSNEFHIKNIKADAATEKIRQAADGRSVFKLVLGHVGTLF